MSNKLPCFFALGGINYKNGFVTSCPQQSDQLALMEQGIIPSEIINNDNFRQHRLDLMSGKWPEGCNLCQSVEADNAGRSMRDWREADQSFYDPATGMIDFKSLKHVELRFSNSCNRACLHCSDVYSSGWISKLKHYVPDEEDRTHRLIQLTREVHKKSIDEDLEISIDIPEMEKIVNDLNKNFPNIDKIDFAGGEVLYQKQFFPCLAKLAEHPNAKNISLTFHTNFNARFDPAELTRLLRPFGDSKIHISIDAGKNIYPYFRTGSWETLVSNLKRFRELNDFTLVGAVCTTSAFQIMDIEDVFRSLLTLDVEWINGSIAYDPKYINPGVMMFDFKDAVLGDIKKTYKIIDDELARRYADFNNTTQMRSWKPAHREFNDIKSAKLALNNIESYVKNSTGSQYSEFEAFQVFIRKTDVIWKHSFNDYMTNYKFENNKIRRVNHV